MTRLATGAVSVICTLHGVFKKWLTKLTHDGKEEYEKVKSVLEGISQGEGQA